MLRIVDNAIGRTNPSIVVPPSMVVLRITLGRILIRRDRRRTIITTIITMNIISTSTLATTTTTATITTTTTTSTDNRDHNHHDHHDGTLHPVVESEPPPAYEDNSHHNHSNV
ncbi:hypothetical protein LXA43DRAFT_1103158 [Ganoderma leucocontextum]|nr:hypothetical protein LXA43DRAFT_1103158 [Ganoderma leucocontextum]